MRPLGSKGKKTLLLPTALRSHSSSCLQKGKKMIAALLLLTPRKEEKNCLECGIYLRSHKKRSLASSPLEEVFWDKQHRNIQTGMRRTKSSMQSSDQQNCAQTLSLPLIFNTTSPVLGAFTYYTPNLMVYFILLWWEPITAPHLVPEM